MELFLDTNAHMPMSEPAINAFIATNNSLAGHGHALSPSVPGRSAESAIEKAREEIAEVIGAETPNQIFFTSTCTQACEWGIDIFRNINKGFIYCSPTEHPAVLQALNKNNKNLLNLNIDQSTRIDSSMEFPENSGVVCMLVQNEVGLIQPIFDLKAKSIFCDMSQAPGKVKLPKLFDIKNLDVAVFGAHKFGGPVSVGFVYIRDVNYWFKKDTGSRYFLDRAGTPDTCSIVACSAALKYAVNTLDERRVKCLAFRNYVENEMENLGFKIIAKDVERVPGTTFAAVPEGKYSQVLMYELGQRGIYIGLGSACGSTYTGVSPLIRIISQNDTAQNYIRISQYGEYGLQEAKYFIDILKDIL